MMAPSQLPAGRVIKNLLARITKNEKDGEAEYLLGRTYYSLYCSRDPRVIALYGTESAPRFPRVHTSPWEFKGVIGKDPVAISNMQSALKHLGIAVQLGGSEPGLHQLTLACAYEASAPVAAQLEPGGTSAAFKLRALKAYETSFTESRPKDKLRSYGQMPGTYESWISIEAAEGILRLDPKSRMSAEIKAHQQFMRQLPSGPITPLIFSIKGPRSLTTLLDPSRVVRFDLDGTGAPQRYSWVKSDTAFLVWQPVKGTRIRSGRQLFGSATWWLMPRNAYAAMSLLDDNADGWLSGAELRSLAVWMDANQNGVAEPSEVVSVDSVGISGLKTSYTGKIGESLVSVGGLRMTNGRVLPTYDWVTRRR